MDKVFSFQTLTLIGNLLIQNCKEKLEYSNNNQIITIHTIKFYVLVLRLLTIHLDKKCVVICHKKKH